MPIRLRALFLLASANAGCDVPGPTDNPAAKGGVMLAASLQESNTLPERRIAERTRELEKMAMTDPLTSLLNRGPLLKLAEAERARAARSKDMTGVMWK